MRADPAGPGPGLAGKPRPLLLTPRRWPVRWRLAGVSAGLTFVILVCVAVVVGRLTSDRLNNDFRTDTAEVASNLALQLTTRYPAGDFDPSFQGLPTSGESVVRLLDSSGDVVDQTAGAPDFGTLAPSGEAVQIADWEVATNPINTSIAALNSNAPVLVQYARNRTELEATIGRLWLLLIGGVIGGTLLATLAGLAVANRAMSPVASLTGAARRIATTRDPSLKIPQPESDDEVAELARTLEEMLAALDAARAETEAVVEAQREFVADASHELRTPLTSILANLELLEIEIDDPDDAEVLAGALGSTRRMRHLVSDLLLLARADAGRIGSRREIDLAKVATAALTELRPLATEHRLSSRIEAEPHVLANADEIHRLVLNLLDNAVRHTPPGSAIELGLSSDGSTARIEVADDGPGVPESLRDQVFSRFARGDGPSDVRGDPGTGLGLAIVSAVAESHGGSVAVGESRFGGALFSVELPLAAPAERAGGHPDQQPADGQKPRDSISPSI
ncbi:HAMP domain-containing histidine kinase [Thermoleophilia bacterium SCSIO 60948]|nr:HAMP domain-containing histidine kinase [Thermoleophilia bacterium SCSIO 60948]